MATSFINLAKNFSIPSADYAGQGNAILGIRDSGKTYTAMKAAEELLESNIPIICYDPVGVWKNLKIGTGRSKGYPVVVAGGEGADIRLTVNNATDIVRAAMKERVSLVIDLYSPELINKATWIKIVQETVQLMVYENKAYGQRHIFLEEAAEFIPQRLQPQHAKVYAAIEQLARIGRNASLGYTIINQRAEEVNKAVLEISELCLLHKQVGKNSLASIAKWLDVLQVENAKDVLRALPALNQGECFVIGTNNKPFQIKILQKKTFHPNPKLLRQTADVQKASADVSGFVKKMNEQLQAPAQVKSLSPPGANTSALNANITSLQEENKKLREQVDQLAAANKKLLQSAIEKAAKAFENAVERIQPHFQKISEIGQQLKAETVEVAAQKISTAFQPIHKPFTDHNRNFTDKVYAKVKATTTDCSFSASGGILRMLQAACMYHPQSISVQRMGVLAGMVHTSGTFGNYLRKLKSEELITGDTKHVTATEKGISVTGKVALPSNPEDLLEMWIDNVGRDGGMAKMLRYLFRVYPHWKSASELGENVGMIHTSGTFGNYERKLRSLNLIEKQDGSFKASDELFH